MKELLRQAGLTVSSKAKKGAANKAKDAFKKLDALKTPIPEDANELRKGNKPASELTDEDLHGTMVPLYRIPVDGAGNYRPYSRVEARIHSVERYENGRKRRP